MIFAVFFGRRTSNCSIGYFSRFYLDALRKLWKIIWATLDWRLKVFFDRIWHNKSKYTRKSTWIIFEWSYKPRNQQYRNKNDFRVFDLQNISYLNMEKGCNNTIPANFYNLHEYFPSLYDPNLIRKTSELLSGEKILFSFWYAKI